MFYIRKNIVVSFLMIICLSVGVTSQNKSSDTSESDVKREKKRKKNKVKLPKIDLSHWSVTIPKGDGKPITVKPPEILEYATNETLKPYMYNDSVSGTIVFYAFPSNATTPNSKYSRSELREQMVPGDNNVNWTFAQGGTMKGRLAMEEVSRDADGNYHKVIIMQIHGRLTNDQRDLIGQKDNNAPPILKIYWDKGRIRVKTKVLKNLNTKMPEILHEDAWEDDNGHTFKQEVGFRKFSIEISVSEGKLVVGLNKDEYAVYKDDNIRKWGVFENYFKAGNYFQTRDEGAFAKVKFYELSVSH